MSDQTRTSVIYEFYKDSSTLTGVLYMTYSRTDCLIIERIDFDYSASTFTRTKHIAF
jgi:hypothetical protein